jgi:hypothetical protein
MSASRVRARSAAFFLPLKGRIEVGMGHVQSLIEQY